MHCNAELLMNGVHEPYYRDNDLDEALAQGERGRGWRSTP
jgi:hypothetical protein